MSDHRTTLMNDQLSKPTSIFGLRLWVVLGVCVGAAFVLLLFLISLWLTSKRNSSSKIRPSQKPTIPAVSKEIQEIRIDHGHRSQIQADPFPESDQLAGIEGQALLLPPGEESPVEQASIVAPEVSHLGWGHWYTLRELEASTNAFADDHVIGEGGYGIVYHGVLEDNTQVAVKNLLNNRGQAEKEFKVEVEAIGRVRHKNLVRLLGYCAEGAHRMLVYEYVNSGNLEQWLHGDVGPRSPLTWEIRMNIILGTAKGLTYLHEGLEPKVVHRDINRATFYLISIGIPRFQTLALPSSLAQSTAIYVAPEYASTGMLNERSDVYSFGILIMEIISGRNPVDYSRPPEEVNLVDWLKRMVTNRNPEGVLDPKIPEKPTSRALKRALLVALRCVDPNSQKRPKMGHVIHMLEAEESPFRDDRRAGRDSVRAHHDSPRND
ncbi:putative serine/threonine-protein kinase [Vitis vinifera]|uniref:non-specific serine/threonine protein kinase n=1 Tax=Vitis vinifera TaxID=29760 RepID=A0A438F5W5_VITVI|nr:putative serine/threonine-protein kinase [Vitis vinifera]